MVLTYDEYKKKKKKEIEERNKKEYEKNAVNVSTKKTATKEIAPVRQTLENQKAMNLFTQLANGGNVGTNSQTPLDLNKISAQQNKATKKKDERTWFNSGYFADGYQFGDISKTILGTTKDVKQDLTRGVLRIGEGVVDTGAYLVGGASKLLGNDELADKTKKFIARDLVGESGIANLVANSRDMSELGVKLGKNVAEAIKNKDASYLVDKNTAFELESILGDKSDSLVQSAGQLGGTIGLSAVGVPWWLTTGVSSFGGETQQAFNQDATYGEAGFSGLVSAGAEILTEKISGGIKFGGKTLDEGLQRLISEKITNKALKTATKFGVDVVGEGSEEVLSEIISSVGKKLSYEDEKTWEEMLLSEEAMDSYLEAFIGGAVLGGAGSVGQSIMASQQKAVQQAEQELGRQLTTEERTKIEEAVERQQENASNQNVKEEIAPIKEQDALPNSKVRDKDGKLLKVYHGTRADFDTFDTSKAGQNYQNNWSNNGKGIYFTDDKAEALEFAKSSIDNGDPKVKEAYLDITNPFDSSKDYTNELSDMAKEYGIEPYYLERGDRLFNWFNANNKDIVEALKKYGYDGVVDHGHYTAFDSNQIKSVENAQNIETTVQNIAPIKEVNPNKDLKRTNFKYVANETDSTYKKAVYESASKVMNDTEASHKFADVVAKISEDKQTSYRFTNNKELKKQGLEFKGLTINGLVNENGEVLINVDSEKALNTILGHETTHLLEGTKEYQALKEVAIEYAKTTGEYQSRLDKINKLYKDKNVDVEAELTSDIVGEYLFTNEKFVKELSVQQPTVFQKIKSLIDDLVVRFKGTAEEKQLRQLQKTFEKAYKQNTSKTDTKYSLSSEGLNKLADEFGGGKNYWEANLYDKDLYGAVYYLKRESSVKNKFKELNNIKIEPVYKDTELKGIGSTDENIQKFIKDNNLNVVDLVNNQKLLDQFYELEHEAIKKQFNVDDVEADEIFSQWKGYFEQQKGNNEVLWPLKRFEKDFKNIIEGNTKEIDNIETAKLERQLVDDNPEFEKYVTKYAEKLFSEKVEYDVDDVMEEAKYQHGTTDNFEVGAYMTTDGSLLNFNDGGYRDDHRTISVFGLNMKEFMDYGAIRMQPETPGFEMQVEPTSEQYSRLYDYIDYIKSTRKSDDTISIDIDKGNSYDGATYNMNTPTSKIISDVKTYWKTGKFPKQSDLSQFRYSLDEDIAPIDEDILPENNEQKTITKEWTDKVNEQNEVNEPLAKEQAKATGHNTMVGYSPILSNYKLYSKGSLSWVTPDGKLNSKVIAETEIDSFLSKNKIDRLVGGINAFENGLSNQLTTKEDIAPVENKIKNNQALYNYVKENKMLVSATDKLGEILDSGSFDASRTSVGSYDKGTRISEYGKFRVHFKPDVLDQVDKMYKSDGATRRQQVKESTNVFSTREEMIYNHPTTTTGQATYDELTFKSNLTTDMIDKVEIPYGTEQSIINKLQEKGIAYEFYTAKEKSKTNESSTLSLFGKKTNQDIAPIKQELNDLTSELKETIKDTKKELKSLTSEINEVKTSIEEAKALTESDIPMVEAQASENLRTAMEDMIPTEEEYYANSTVEFPSELPEIRPKKDIVNNIKDTFGIKTQEARDLYDTISRKESVDEVYEALEDYREVTLKDELVDVKEIKKQIRNTRLDVSDAKKQITDYNAFRKSHFGSLKLTNSGVAVDSFYQELAGQYPEHFPSEITNIADQLEYLANFMKKGTTLDWSFAFTDSDLYDIAERLYVEIGNKERYEVNRKSSWFLAKELRTMEDPESVYGSIASNPNKVQEIAPIKEQTQEVAPINEQTQEVAPTEEITFKETPNESEDPFIKAVQNQIKRHEPKQATNLEADDYKDNHNVKPKKKTLKESASKTWDAFQSHFVNRNRQIDKLSKASGNSEIKFKGDRVNNIAGEVGGDIFTAQTDNYGNVIGKSLDAPFQQSREAGLDNYFDNYLKHQSNIERHERGKGSAKVSLKTSQDYVNAYESKYPQFKEWARDVYTYNQNLLNNAVQNGLIDSKFKDMLTSMYGKYVPFYGDTKEIDPSVYESIDTIKTSKPIKRAKGGSGANLLGIEQAMIQQTYAYKNAIAKNDLYKEIGKVIDQKVKLGADVRTSPTQLETTLYSDENGKYLSYYDKGQLKTVQISDDLYTELSRDLEKQIRNLEEKYSLITKPLQKISQIRGQILTTYNAGFVVTNPFKDIQDALLNTKNIKGYLKNVFTQSTIRDSERGKNVNKYAEQFKTLTGKDISSVKNASSLKGKAKALYNDYQAGTMWNRFITSYGTNATSMEFGEAGVDVKAKNKGFLNSIERANNYMEVMFRYPEFKATLEKGKSFTEALYNAREVTTNFGRGGTVSKAINRNGATFFNTSVQGLDKFVRNFSGENGARGFVGAVSKAVMLGMAPALLNDLLFGFGDDQDEEYEALPDYIKDNYYLFKTGEGEFIRVPKGRMISVLGSSARRTLELANGEKDAFDGFLKNASDQVGATNPLKENIFSPLIQAYGSENGEAWYGGDLVPTRLQSKPKAEQYDEGTDEFSKWLAKQLDKVGVEVSPYKLNYVIDQYSGGFGDLILPMITKEANSNGTLLAPLKDKFTANSTDDNKYVGELYDLSEELTIKANGENATEEDKLKNKYLNSIKSQMSELYKAKREIQNSDFSKEAKYQQAQMIQRMINALAKEGLDFYTEIEVTDNYANVGYYEDYYKTSEGEWYSVNEDEIEDLDLMGMTTEEKNSYFGTKRNISTIKDKYEDSESEDKYTSQKREIIDEIRNTNLTDEAKSYLYDKYYASTDKLNVITETSIPFDTYLDLEYQDFKADKDKYGNSISGSKKAKIVDYIENSGLDYNQKIVLHKMYYPADDSYNYDVVDYIVNNVETYETRINILETLGFKIDEDGTIYWD